MGWMGMRVHCTHVFEAIIPHVEQAVPLGTKALELHVPCEVGLTERYKVTLRCTPFSGTAGVHHIVISHCSALPLLPEPPSCRDNYATCMSSITSDVLCCGPDQTVWKVQRGPGPCPRLLGRTSVANLL